MIWGPALVFVMALGAALPVGQRTIRVPGRYRQVGRGPASPERLLSAVRPAVRAQTRERHH